MLLHASCVAIENKGVLIAGPPGIGKSDLAARLIDEGAQLVSDDQTDILVKEGILIATPPASIAGMIEIRHVGLMKLPFVSSVAVALYIDLIPPDQKLERLPEADPFFLLDCSLQRLRLPAFTASAPAKIRMALSYPCVVDP